MAQELTVQAVGLVTNTSAHTMPQGALSRADDVVVSKKNVIEPARGFSGLATTGVSGSVKRLIRHSGTLLAFDSLNRFGHIDTSGAFVFHETIEPNPKLRSMAANGNLYLTGRTGLRRVSGPATSASDAAGVPPGMIGSVSKTGTVGAAQATDSQVAYRVLWVNEDRTGNVEYGAPSGRSIYVNPAVPSTWVCNAGFLTGTVSSGITNPFSSGSWITLQDGDVEADVLPGDYQVLGVTGSDFYVDLSNVLTFADSGETHRVGFAAQNLSVPVVFPRDVGPTHYFQLYRSPSSLTSDIEASDEMGLVFESDNYSFFSGTATMSGVAGQARVSATLPTPHGLSVGDWVYVSAAAALGGPGVFPIVSVSGVLDLVYQPTGSVPALLQANATLYPRVANIVDVIPDSIIGASLYTNPNSGEGPAQANDQPPTARDVVLFKGSVFLADTVSRDLVSTQMMTVPDLTSGFVSMSFVQFVDGTASLTETFSWGTADLTTDANASVTQEIAYLANKVVGDINRTSQIVRAFYTSNVDDIPGKMSFESVAISADPTDFFTFSTSVKRSGGAPDPSDPMWLPSYTTSSKDVWRNGLFYSKTEEPEAFPRFNYFRVGNNDAALQKLFPLQNSLILFKEDGIFSVQGDGPSSFRVAPIDTTVIITAPDSADSTNNRVYALTELGVVAVSEDGVQNISDPIDDQLYPYLTPADRANLFSSSFGVCYANDRKYWLFVPPTGSSAVSKAFVYDFYTQAWTVRRAAVDAGLFDPNQDILVLHGRGNLLSERKSFGPLDYCDSLQPNTISGTLSGSVLTVTSQSVAPDIRGGSGTVAAGDVVFQGPHHGVVLSVSGSSLQLDRSPSFTTASLSYGKPVSSVIRWSPKTGGNPGQARHYRQVALSFQDAHFTTGTFRFYGDQLSTSGSEPAEVVQYSGGKSGLGPNSGSMPVRVRVSVPRNVARRSELSVEFEHSTAAAPFQLTGLSITMDAPTDNVGRKKGD